MSLTDSYVQVYGQLPDFFRRIADGQAPSNFTTQYVKDLGFASSNFRAVIPLLKSLGFLSPDGVPTNRYHEYRNLARSRQVLGDAVKEAYGDLFTIKAKPTDADRALIEGKFRSVHNATANTSRLMASTFYALLDLADLDTPEQQKAEQKPKEESTTGTKPDAAPAAKPTETITPAHGRTSLHYDIQIHLPATKDVEVYNAIFKSLKEHLLE